MRQDTRPVNLNLFTIHFPVTAIASISHRITGFICFFLVPILLYLLQHSISSLTGFDEVITWFQCFWVKLIMLGFFTSLLYHLLASIRHYLIMDFGYAETIRGARITAWGCFILTAIGVILMGYWLW